MRRFRFSLVVIVVAAFAVIGSAIGSNAPTKVSGHGQRGDIDKAFAGYSGYTPTFTISTLGDRGTMFINWGAHYGLTPKLGGPYSTIVNVTGVCVKGDEATVVGIITGGTNAVIGDELMTTFKDGGGSKSDGMLGVFQGADELLGKDLKEVCENPYLVQPDPNVMGFLPLTSGNINITDAS